MNFRAGDRVVQVGRVDPETKRNWVGDVLLDADPRAWANSLAFPSDQPDPQAVAAHVAHLKTQSWYVPATPVRWEFGRIYWEKPETLRLAREPGHAPKKLAYLVWRGHHGDDLEIEAAFTEEAAAERYADSLRAVEAGHAGKPTPVGVLDVALDPEVP